MLSVSDRTGAPESRCMNERSSRTGDIHRCGCCLHVIQDMLCRIALEAASTATAKATATAAHNQENPDYAAAVISSAKHACAATSAATAEQKDNDEPAGRATAISLVTGTASAAICC